MLNSQIPEDVLVNRLDADWAATRLLPPVCLSRPRADDVL
jgi:hypothetical protein